MRFSLKTLTAAGSVLAVAMGLMLPSTSQAHTPKFAPTPPTAQQAGLHSKALERCKRDGKGSCKLVVFRHEYSHLVEGYWNREWRHREHDFDYALTKAAQQFGVSRSWLKGCNRSEGGAGPWKWNGGTYLLHSWETPRSSSGAGGPMQFMRTTYHGYVTDIPHYRKILPPIYWAQDDGTPSSPRAWKLRAGQAYVAAYMFSIGKSSQWTGLGC